MVVLLVVALAAHVGVDGVAGIEESVTDAVGLAQGDAQTRQSRNFQFTCIAVIGVVVRYGSRGFEQPEFGVAHRLLVVAHASRSQQAQRLVADAQVAAPGQVAPERRERRLFADREVRVEDILPDDLLAELRERAVHGARIDRRLREERAVAHAVEGLPEGVEAPADVEVGREEILAGILLGVDVDVRARVVGVGAHLVDLAHGDVADDGRGEDVERDELVVGVGRGNGLSVEGRDAVTVAQTADDELSGRGDGDAGDLPDALLDVRDPFERHFAGAHVLDRHVRGDAVGLEAAFRFEVPAPLDRNRLEGLRVGCKFDRKRLVCGGNPDLDLLREVGDVGDGERVRALGKVHFEGSRSVGRRALCRPREEDRGADERFAGRSVENSALEVCGEGGAGAEEQHQKKQRGFLHRNNT